MSHRSPLVVPLAPTEEAKQDSQERDHTGDSLFKQRKYRDAASAYRRLVEEKNDIQAKLSLAFIYYHGLDGKKKIEKALALLRSAASEGDISAKLELGMHFLKEKKFTQAKMWFQKAEIDGSFDAKLFYARCLHDEDGSAERANFNRYADKITKDLNHDLIEFKGVIKNLSEEHRFEFRKRYARAWHRIVAIRHTNRPFVQCKEEEKKITEALENIDRQSDGGFPEVRLLICLLYLYGSEYGLVDPELDLQGAYKCLKQLELAFVESPVPRTAKHLYAKFFLIYLEERLGIKNENAVKAALIGLATEKYPSPLDDRTLLPAGEYEEWIPVGVSDILRQPAKNSLLYKSLSAFHKKYKGIYSTLNGNEEPILLLPSITKAAPKDGQELHMAVNTVVSTFARGVDKSFMFVVGNLKRPFVWSFQFCGRGIQRCRAKVSRLYQAKLYFDNGDFGKALQIYQALARKGNVDAMGMAGMLLSDGQVEGVKIDLALAANYLSVAAEAGNPDVQFYWGRYLLLQKKDIDGAKKWFKKASDQGHLKAKLFYACLWFNKEREERHESATPGEYADRLCAYYDQARKGIPDSERGYLEGISLFVRSSLLLVDDAAALENDAIKYLEKYCDHGDSEEKEDRDATMLWGLLNLYGSKQRVIKQDEKNAFRYFQELYDEFDTGSYKFVLARFFEIFLNENDPDRARKMHQLAQQYELPIDLETLCPKSFIEEWVPLRYRDLLSTSLSREFKNRLRAFAREYRDEYNKTRGIVEVEEEYKHEATLVAASAATEEKELDVAPEVVPLKAAIENIPSQQTAASAQSAVPKGLAGMQASSAAPSKVVAKSSNTPGVRKKKKPVPNTKGGTFAWYFGPSQSLDVVVLATASAEGKVEEDVKKENKQRVSTGQKKQSTPRTWRDDWTLSLQQRPVAVSVPDGPNDEMKEKIKALKERLRQKKSQQSSHESNATHRRRLSDSGLSDLHRWKLMPMKNWSEEEIKFSPKLTEKLINLKLAKQGKSGVMLSSQFLVGPRKYSAFVGTLQLLDNTNDVKDLNTHLPKILEAIAHRALIRPASLSVKHHEEILGLFRVKLQPLIKTAEGAPVFLRVFQAMSESLMFNNLLEESNLKICQWLGLEERSKWAEEGIKFSQAFSRLLKLLGLATEDSSGFLKLSNIFIGEASSGKKYSEFVESLQLLDQWLCVSRSQIDISKIFEAINQRKLDKPKYLSEEHYIRILGFFRSRFNNLVNNRIKWDASLAKNYQEIVSSDNPQGKINEEICFRLGIKNWQQKNQPKAPPLLTSTAMMLQRQNEFKRGSSENTQAASAAAPAAPKLEEAKLTSAMTAQTADFVGSMPQGYLSGLDQQYDTYSGYDTGGVQPAGMGLMQYSESTGMMASQSNNGYFQNAAPCYLDLSYFEIRVGADGCLYAVPKKEAFFGGEVNDPQASSSYATDMSYGEEGEGNGPADYKGFEQQPSSSSSGVQSREGDHSSQSSSPSGDSLANSRARLKKYWLDNPIGQRPNGEIEDQPNRLQQRRHSAPGVY